MDSHKDKQPEPPKPTQYTGFGQGFLAFVGTLGSKTLGNITDISDTNPNTQYNMPNRQALQKVTLDVLSDPDAGPITKRNAYNINVNNQVQDTFHQDVPESCVPKFKEQLQATKLAEQQGAPKSKVYEVERAHHVVLANEFEKNKSGGGTFMHRYGGTGYDATLQNANLLKESLLKKTDI